MTDSKAISMSRQKRITPNKVSMCGDTGKPCSWMPRCAVNYSNTGWFTDDQGNRARIIEGGFCVRETLPQPDPDKKRGHPHRKHKDGEW